MQSGAYQNGTWVVGVAKGGVEEGVDSLAQSLIIAPCGQIVAQAVTTDDELIVAALRPRLVPRVQGHAVRLRPLPPPELYDADHGPAGRRRTPGGPTSQIDAAALDAEPGRRRHRRRSSLNGAAVAVRADHPHLLAALREELDVTSPKDGCSPSGQCGCCTVLIDGKAVVSLPAAAGEGRRAGRSSRSRASTPTSASASPTPSPPAAACSAASASPASSCGPRRRSTRRAPDLTRDDDGPPPRRPPLPLHRLREGPRRHRGGRRRQGARAARRPAASGAGGMKYEAPRADARRPRLHRRPPRARHAARRAAPDRARPRRHRRHRHRRRREAAPGVVAVFTAADIPGELRVGHHPHRLAGDDPGRAAARPTSATCSPSSWRRPASRPGPRPPSSRSTYDVLAPYHRPRGGHRRPRDRGLGHRLQRPVACRRTSGATSRRRWRPAPTSCTRCSRPSASSTPSSSRSRRWPCPIPAAGTMHVYSGGQGVWDDRNQIAAVLGRRARPGHRRAGVERRRLRRQGGHEQPGPDGAGRLAAAAAGQVHALPGGVPAHAPQAPPDPHGVRGRLRRRRPADGAAGARGRRLRRVRQRRA